MPSADRSSSDADVLLRARGVSVRFAGVTACDKIDVDIHVGEILAVIGPNGAGKTSLVNALTGASRVERGSSVLFFAEGETELVQQRPDRIVRLGVTRTFQNLLLIDELTVAENVLLGRLVHQRSGIVRNLVWTRGARREDADHRGHVAEALELVDLTEHRGTVVRELPYGLRKRVELARAIAGRPRLMVLDEPVAGMSRNEKTSMSDYIVRARDSFDCGILLIEHDMGMVMSIADRIMAMDAGRSIFVGTPEEARRDEHVIRAYLGTE